MCASSWQRVVSIGTSVASALAVLAANATAQRVYFDDSLHALVPPGYHDGWTNDVEVPAAFGDFDGDGDLDLAQGKSLLLNDGSGAYHALRTGPPPSPSVYEAVRAWASGDLNGDGFVDLVSAGSESDAIYFGDGTGQFTRITTVPPVLPVDDSYDVKLADIDGDGDLDVLFANRVFHQGNGLFSPGSVLLWRNDGGGLFVDAHTQIAASPIEDPIAIALGDFDGDGDLDLFVVNTQAAGLTNQHRMLLNDGLGTFSDATNSLPLFTTYRIHYSALATDLDGDGNVDVLIGGWIWLRNYGAASFANASSAFPLSSFRAEWGDVGDVDGNGLLDIVGVDGYGRNRVLLQQPAGVFTLAASSPSFFQASYRRVLLRDVDGDGDLDAHVVRHGAGVLLLNDGTGNFVETSPEPLTDGPTSSTAHGDVDGDGDVDVYVVRAGQDRLLLNDGSGAFVDASTQLPIENGWATHAEFVDIDGDHDLDLLIGAYDFVGAPTPLLYTNDGLGFFTDATAQWTSLPTFMDPFATADVDGDGDVDVLAGAYGHPTQLYLNDGVGNLSPSPSPWPSSAAGDHVLLFGDLDGDGDQDAIGFGAGVSVYINNGAGVFQPSLNTGVPTSAFLFPGSSLADFDGDGDLDFVARVTGPGGTFKVRAFLNDGAAHFSGAGVELPPVISAAACLTAGDIDDDGDVDLWFVEGNARSFQLLLNDGHAVFVDSADSVRISNTETAALDLADLDGDGDLDGLVAGVFGGSFAVPNLTRHVVWRTLPRIGRALELEVHGEPGAGFQLFGSLAGAQVPFGAAGTLRIDRTQIVEQLHGTFDAEGRALATRQIPADPALVGRTVYWQALNAHPRRFTNLETTTFVSL